MQTTIATTAHPPAAVGASPSRARLIIATSLGNGLEIFDFTVYSFFAALIGAEFFPAADPLSSLLFSVGVFGLGFLMRPLGAVVLGAYADRAGRRAAMTMTIWLMAAGTALIGLCPPHAMIGLAAPLIVLCGRLLQGFAAGGEVGAATTFLMESGTASRRGFMVSWQATSQAAAALVGAGAGVLLSQLLSPAQLSSWGWRLPFMLGLLVAPVGIYIRRQLHESHQLAPAARQAFPLAELFRHHGRAVVLAILMIAGSTVSMYTMVYFMPSYLTRVMHLPPMTGFLAATVSSLVMLVVTPLSGLIADRTVRRKSVVLCSFAAMTAAVMPVFMILAQATPAAPQQVLVAVGFFTVLMSIGGVSMLLIVMEVFPPHVRATGLGFAYAVAVTAFGGTSQFAVTWLIDRTGNPLAAGWYVQACCVVSLLAIIAFKDKRA